MTPEQRRRLEAAGFRRGTVQEFLGLSDREMAALEVAVTSEPAAARVQREELAKGNPLAVRLDQKLRVNVSDVPPPTCAKCGESAGAECGEPCTIVSWDRPDGPPAIGPLYHTRCYEKPDKVRIEPQPSAYSPIHDPAKCIICRRRIDAQETPDVTRTDWDRGGVIHLAPEKETP